TLVVSVLVCSHLLVSFLFQAEDGIRDRNVTGVQTCALPISFILQYLQNECDDDGKGCCDLIKKKRRGQASFVKNTFTEEICPHRSEERRVGKEWRCREWRDE